MTEPALPTTREPGGCLLFLAVGLLMALASCSAVLLLLLPRDPAIETVSKTELASPDGRHTAIVYDREQPAFLDRSRWSELAIRTGQAEQIVGSMGRPRPEISWLNARELRVLLHGRPSLDASAEAMGVTVTYHLSAELNVRTYHAQLRNWERVSWGFAESRQYCHDIYGRWDAARRFWEWARRYADNGEPDPGTWMSELFPADCSTLPKP